MFQKNERCFSAIGFEYEYVCPTTDGQHIVRPVLESEGGETVYGDLRQVDKVYTAEECDNLAYAKRTTLQAEIDELNRQRAALRLTSDQQEALAQHETLANLADWLAGKVMYFVSCTDRDVDVRSTAQTGGQLSIRRARNVATCEWWIDGSKATFRGMFATKEQAEEVARSIVQSNLVGESSWCPQVEPSIQSAQRLGVPVPEKLLASREDYQRKVRAENLARAKLELEAAQERLAKLADQAAA